MSVRSPILLSLLLAAAATAQTDLVLPRSAAQSEAAHVARGPFVSASFRWQQIWRTEAMAALGFTIQSLHWRRDDGPKSQGRTFAARTFDNLTLRLGPTAVAPDGMGTTFAGNLTGAMTTAFAGTVALPVQFPPVLGHLGPFDITMPLQQPFTMGVNAGDLVLDLRCQASAAPSGDYNLDADVTPGVTGSTATRYGQGGPFANGDQVSYDLESRFLPFAGVGAGPTVRFAATGLTQGYPAFALFGLSDQRFGPLALPLPLDGFGAPGNVLLASAEVQATLATTAVAGGYRAALQLDLPANPALAGARLFTQVVFADAASNALGLVFGNAVRFQLGGAGGHLTQSVGAPDANAAAGAFGVGAGIGGPVTRFVGLFQ